MVRKAALIATAALALSAGSASAQNSSTNCYRLGNNVQCNTYTQPALGGLSLATPPPYPQNQAPQFDWNAFNKAQADRLAQKQAQQKAQESENSLHYRESLRSNVAALLERGDCRGAMSLALRGNDMELAGLVGKVCHDPQAIP